MIKTLLIGYDDSDPSRRALERAAMLAKAFESKLIVTSVAPVTTPASARSVGTDPTDTPADHLAELATARTYLEGQGLTAEYIEALGHPADSILTAARDHSADLIVIGAREMGFLQRLLGQSVSAEISREARCDVLIVH